MYNKSEVVTLLELIEKKAKYLASSVENNKLWGGELNRGIMEIREYVSKLDGQVGRHD